MLVSINCLFHSRCSTTHPNTNYIHRTKQLASIYLDPKAYFFINQVCKLLEIQ
jgi:hypothetical protein